MVSTRCARRRSSSRSSLEGDQSARAVEVRLEKVEAGGSIEVVPDVVLAAPDELDRGPRALRDPGGLGHEVAARCADQYCEKTRPLSVAQSQSPSIKSPIRAIQTPTLVQFQT